MERSRRDGGRMGGEAEVGEDPLDGISSRDGGDHHAPAATVGTAQNIDGEDAFEQLGPGVAAVGGSAAAPC